MAPPGCLQAPAGITGVLAARQTETRGDRVVTRPGVAARPSLPLRAHRPGTPPLALLSLTALGVVYGDIGTSPLYALKACFSPAYGLQPTPGNVYGLLSLIVWSLTLVVSVKYIVFIMRADNHGEGGILALLALIRQQRARLATRRRMPLFVALGLIGAALLYGDGVITPAISVLSAVEGLKIAAPALGHVVLPSSCAILVLLFVIQRRGTARVGGIFGPLMLVWFIVIGVLGAAEVARTPAVLLALNPWHGLTFLAEHGTRGLLALGAVVLAVTGAEALYADMGHFGTRPIRVAWFALVFPALLLNYFGQGALLLRSPAAVANPFYLMAPAVFLYPLVLLATLATIVASQALISGAFSLTQQAMQLGYAPRMRVVHTSAVEAGQIYIPTVNTALMVACLCLVVGFRSSDRLAAAYGIAVTGTMAITSVLFYVIARSYWHWSPARAGALTALFLAVDLAFLGTNLLKVVEGGWVPVAIAAGVYTLLSTWGVGRRSLLEIRRKATLPLEVLVRHLEADLVARVPGTAVFLTGHARGAPDVLLLLLKHMKALQREVVLLSLAPVDVPEVPVAERVSVERLPHGFARLRVRTGFMQTPRPDDVLASVRPEGIATSPSETTYFLAREHLLPTGSARMARWRKRLFIFMARNAHPAADFFDLPLNRVVELGLQVEL